LAGKSKEAGARRCIVFLKHVPTEDLVEVIDLTDVINPHSPTILARSHAGEVIQRPENFLKTELSFPSGEPLPKCWIETECQENAENMFRASA
jgi:hypothetical protein